MDCPICNIEMSHGALFFGGAVWRKGPVVKSKFWKTWPWVKEKNYNIRTYRCDKCGKIEQTSDLDGI